MRKHGFTSCMSIDPLHPCLGELRRRSLWICGIVAVLALFSLFFADAQLGLYFSSEDLREFRRICRTITDFAEGSYYIGFVIIMYLAARFAFPYLPAFVDRKDFLFRVRRMSRFSLIALLLSGFAVHFVKFCFGRQRPHLSPEFDPFVFVPFNFDWHFQSFPSGHSQVIFSVASLASMTWPPYRRYFLILAGLIAVTRVILAQHFLSDVLVGGALGYLVPQWFFAIYWYKRIKSMQTAAN